MGLGINIPNDEMRGIIHNQDVPEGFITCQLSSSYLYSLHIICFSIIAQYAIKRHDSTVLYNYSVDKWQFEIGLVKTG